jgi:hypothetical protein
MPCTTQTTKNEKCNIVLQPSYIPKSKYTNSNFTAMPGLEVVHSMKYDIIRTEKGNEKKVGEVDSLFHWHWIGNDKIDCSTLYSPFDS